MPAKKKSASKSTAKATNSAQRISRNKAMDTPAKGTQASSPDNSKPAENSAPATASSSTQPGKKMASEFIKRASHTPAIFKPSKRVAQIVFTIDDLREVLRRRAKEEKRDAAPHPLKRHSGSAASSATPPVQKLVPETHTLAPEPPKASKHAAASLDDILGLSGGFFGSPSVSKTVAPKFKKYFDLLTALKKEVSDELSQHSNDTLKRSQKEDSGDISISVDAGTDSFDRDFALSMLSTEQEALKEIEAAIQRIYNGSYGVCEVTGEPIPAERLEAVPFTRYSLDGQRQHEANNRRRVDRAGIFLSEGTGEAISFGDDDSD